MNCLKCDEYIPVNYTICPNCKSPIQEQIDVDIRSGSADNVDDYFDESEAIEGEVVSEVFDFSEAEDTKVCPYCAETIKFGAIICRFCRMDLKTGRLVAIENNGLEFTDIIKYGCLFAAAVPFLIIIWFVILFFILMFRGSVY